MANIHITNNELKGLHAYFENLLAGNNPAVKVGVLNNALYSEASPLAGKSIAVNMARIEYGTKHIPARSPFRSTIANKKKEWAKVFSFYLKDALSSGKDIEYVLGTVGDAMAKDIRTSFDDGLKPSLKPATIRRKIKMKYKDPYKAGVLTGEGVNSITSEYVHNIERK